MTTHTTANEVDATRLLGLSSRAAHMVMWLFIATNFLYVWASLDDVKHAAPVILASLLINGAALLLVREHADPYPLAWTVAILAAVVLSTVLVAWQLPDAGPIGRASWHLGSNTWLLFFVALRRRPSAAWLGYVLMAAVTVGWSLSVGRSVMSAVSSLQTHAAILLVASLFSLNLRRTARRLNELDRRAVQSAVDAAEGATSSQIRIRRVMEIRAVAGHLLESLIRGDAPLGAEEKLTYATAEALLRDGVRGKSLMTPGIAQAANAARELGVDVTLLDDRGQGLASEEAMVRMSDVVVHHLEALTAGEITVRLAPLGRPVALSIVVTGESGHSRIELNADGIVLEGVSA